MKNIVPNSPLDINSCNNLMNASDGVVIEQLPELLEWLEDMNRPVATCVLKRISRLKVEVLIQPIINIINSNDSIWKYWILTALIPRLDKSIIKAISQELQLLVDEANQNDCEEGIDKIAKELLCDIDICSE